MTKQIAIEPLLDLFLDGGSVELPLLAYPFLERSLFRLSERRLLLDELRPPFALVLADSFLAASSANHAWVSVATG